MPDETALTPEQEKQKAVQAFYDAKTREEKAAVVKQYPMLKEIFSEANYS